MKGFILSVALLLFHALAALQVVNGSTTTSLAHSSSRRNHLRILQSDATEDDKDAADEDTANEKNVASENQDGTKDETSDTAAQSTTRGLVDLVHLVPFDVQIAVTKNKGIQSHEVSNIVTSWMNQAYIDQLTAFGFTEANRYASFESVVLFNNDESANTGNNDESANTGNNRNVRRRVQRGELFTAKFRGGAVFSRDATRNRSVPPNDVLLIQQMTLLNDTVLVELLQSSSLTGLGSVVVDVNAFLTPQASNTNPQAQGPTSTGFELEIVILAAIVVAGIAFLFLLGAVVWAYRYDRPNRDVFLAKKHRVEELQAPTAEPASPDRTDSDTVNDNDSPERIQAVYVERTKHMYPTTIGGDECRDTGYPESVISDSIISGSVISEDISTSLSQYYRSGMGKSSDYVQGGGLLSDAGSVSSMESYGYSLDGGMSAVHAAPLPSEIPYQKDRIGGLPIMPAHMHDTGSYDAGAVSSSHMDDVQIPDLDKELANLDIQLIPNMEPIDVESYSQHDLEKYQMQDLEEMEALSQRSPLQAFVATNPMNPGHDPVDVDAVDLGNDTDDDCVAQAPPKPDPTGN